MAYKKLTKGASENEIYVIDLTSLLESGETVSSITSITHSPSGLTISDEQVNTTVVEVDDLEIEANKSIQCRIQGGTENYEYKITIVFVTSDSDTETTSVLLIVDDLTSTEFQEYYGSVTEGDDYFDTRLNVTEWSSASHINKRKALIEATRLIERLNFAGEKSDEDQTLQFPRYEDELVPLDIEMATYEIALQLLKGRDIESELRDSNVTSRRYGPVATSYDTKQIAQHIMAGIPSVRAWQLLKPYLRDPRRVVVSRVS